MRDIFISYKREQKPMAKTLSVALERHGWSVWWDPHLRTGEHFDDAIEEALQDAKCVIVLWSKQSVKSQYVRDEATYALNRNKLIPVAIEDIEPPFRFAGLQTAHLGGWDGSDTYPGFLKIVNDIRSIINSPSALTSEKRQARSEARNPATTQVAESVGVGPQSKNTSSNLTHKRSILEWLLNVVVTAALGFFYLGAVFNACHNDDILAISALIGFPLSVFLIFQKRAYRITWILAPLTSFFIGMPYGHNYGTMSKSPLFGLRQGTKCQSDAAVLIILAVVATAAAIDHGVFLHKRKQK